MIGFCKKSVHSLFNITSSTIPATPLENSVADHRATPSPAAGGIAGLGILTASAEIPKPNNVIESSLVIKRQSKLIDVIDQSNDVIESAKRERGGIGLGFLDGGDSGGRDLDGFASCTESLGFESSNERSNTNEFENEEFEKIKELSRSRVTKKSRNVYVKKELKKFPPPLSSFTNDGKPSFFLRPVRKNGRLELTEVKIHRPKALRASRGDGRLKLHLIEDQVKNDVVNHASEDQFDVKGDKFDVKGKKVEDGRQFPANSGVGGEDCRWLNEMVSHGHHQYHKNLHGWGHRCVTIR